jgi:predicted enzyme involved in methoxymalonyl-ACP biosynthesis
MKIHFISDITLETLAKKQFLNSSHIYSFEFVEDLVSHLSQFDRFANYDMLYIHLDADFKNYSDSYLGYVLNQIHNLSERTSQTILCSNLIGRGWSIQGLHEMISLSTTHSFVCNEALTHLQNKNNFFFFDVQSIIYDLGRSNIYNFKLGHLYQMPYTKSFLDKFSTKFEDYVEKLASPDKKSHCSRLR